MSNKARQDSALVKSVVALDNYLSELERIGTKINSTDMKSDFDVDHIQKLMTRFAECGQGVADEVTNLSTHLRDAQQRADSVAQGVSRQAEAFKERQNELNEKLEEFRLLGEKIREVTTNQAKIKEDLPGFEAQLSMLVDELQKLRKSARESKMRSLERNTESLAQKLDAARKKIRDLSQR